MPNFFAESADNDKNGVNYPGDDPTNRNEEDRARFINTYNTACSIKANLPATLAAFLVTGYTDTITLEGNVKVRDGTGLDFQSGTVSISSGKTLELSKVG